LNNNGLEPIVFTSIVIILTSYPLLKPPPLAMPVHSTLLYNFLEAVFRQLALPWNTRRKISIPSNCCKWI